MVVSKRGDTTTVPALKAARSDRFMTQRELAKAAGVNEITIVRAEKGKRCSFGVVRRLATVLGLEPSALTLPVPEQMCGPEEAQANA